ncbi:MAG: phosphomannomutase/phosphoglucomutase [Gammaproteobacteria bacterium HGW-Gammaproteobacteria-3]|nr:MAG: phosphomannomutase/phosphoglucomutase [Gammaproteobacteria bacterium HGW-Gammaproteobacteria-3]
MQRIFLPLAILAVVLILVTGSGVYWATGDAVNEARQEAAYAATQGAALSIAARIEQLNQALALMAQNREVIEVFVKNDPALTTAVATRLEKYLPGALKIRLLRPDINELDDQHIPHMGFADLDMIRETANKSQLAAIQGDVGTNRHLALTAGVVVDGRVVGVILASLSYDFIASNLKSAAAQDLYIQLRQGGLELAAVGDPRFKNQEHVEINVANSAWTIQGWYTQAANASGFGLVAGIIAISGLLGCLAFFVAYRKTSDMLRQDQSTVLKAVKDLMTGGAHGNYPVYLSEMSGLISTLVQFKRVLDHQEDAMEPNSSDTAEFDGFFEASAFSVEDLTLDADEDAAPDEDTRPTKDVNPNLPQEPEEVKAPIAPDTIVEEEEKPEIFRAYDIRGIVGKTLTHEIVHDIGRAFGSEAKKLNCQTVVIARDGRNSSPDLSDALARGIVSTGCDVLDLGMVPTPVLYFVAHHTTGRTGVMITGSHNPADYNGLKLVLNGETLAGVRIQALKNVIEQQTFTVAKTGKIDQNSMFVNEYIGMIAEDVHLSRPMKVVLDCGNGVAGEIGPILLKTLGCDVIELFCEIDGNFPNHHPDPSKPENLSDLMASVKHYQADIGIAFDGDGDRLGIVDSSGKIIWPDRQMMTFAKNVLARKPGSEIIFDVKCSRHLPEQIVKFGGRPLLWKTGHSLMKAKLMETGAKLAGEMSGHIFFNDRWFGFDDALYSAARMIEIISADSRTSAEVFADFPDSLNTPELNVAMNEGENFSFMEKLLATARFEQAKITDIDGLRADFADGWGLVRASNTTPSLVLRFEADNEQALRKIQMAFKTAMQQIKPDIELPF